MGKSRNKDKSSIEWYKSIIRNLKKEIKQLRSQLHKSQNHIDKDDSDIDDIPEDEPKRLPCTNCGKGSLNEVIIANRLIYTCTTCDFRSKAKIIQKS